VALDDMFTRFPKTKNELAGWYYLYLDHSDLANPRKAQEYYDKIFEKYPTSSYAEALKGGKRGGKDEDTVEKYYATTYALFKDGKYKEAQDRIKESDTKYGISNALKPKFALLNAMCVGHELGRINYIAELKTVMNNYPETPEQKRAAEILRILEFGVPVTESPKNNGGGDDDPVSRFAVGDDKLHYVFVILDKNANLEDAKVIVSDFNSKYFRTENLNISNIYFDPEAGNPVLVIRKFRDKEASLKYTEGVSRNKGDYLQGVYEVFSVSQDNYRELIRQKGVEAYRTFYERNYRN
jgi:tetratricopeptide (TPR) repeat protein